MTKEEFFDNILYEPFERVLCNRCGCGQCHNLVYCKRCGGKFEIKIHNRFEAMVRCSNDKYSNYRPYYQGKLLWRKFKEAGYEIADFVEYANNKINNK